jgi:dihydroxy-acid dehydratase
LALVENGDVIELDVEARRLQLQVSDDELARRRAHWKAPAAHATRGWVKLNSDTVQQPHRGVDLDFLVGSSGAPVARESH